MQRSDNSYCMVSHLYIAEKILSCLPYPDWLLVATEMHSVPLFMDSLKLLLNENPIYLNLVATTSIKSVPSDYLTAGFYDTA